MPTVEILKSHNLKELRSEVSKTNIKKYSKLKKADLIDLMMKSEHKDLFHHMQLKTHKMPSGVVHTGSTHTKDSKPVEKKKEETKKKKIKLIKPKRKEIKVTTFEKPKKKRIKLIKKEKPKVNTVTGLTAEEMNKLSPEELFGKLPVALAKKVLDPKTTGITVGTYGEGGVHRKDTLPPDKKLHAEWYKIRVMRGEETEESIKNFKKLDDKLPSQNYGSKQKMREINLKREPILKKLELYQHKYTGIPMVKVGGEYYYANRREQRANALTKFKLNYHYKGKVLSLNKASVKFEYDTDGKRDLYGNARGVEKKIINIPYKDIYETMGQYPSGFFYNA